MTPLYKLFGLTTFLSAFLLFQIQPLISKHILPWFGGSAMVWITALFFFMLVLLAGYLYVLAISQLTLKNQRLVHIGLLLVVSGIVIFNSLAWPSGITPEFSERFTDLSPTLGILLLLTVSIGAPFFLLSTTSSLLQLWYGQVTNREPFSLYAVSNIGSLLGLLSYPFLFEILFSTTSQGNIWTGLFFTYSLLLAFVIFKAKAPVKLKTTDAVASERPDPTPSLILKWVIMASLPVAIMLTSTGYISGFIASVPLIWIIPLGLYLLSFIVTFRGGERKMDQFMIVLVALALTLALGILLIASMVTVPVILLVLWASVFAVSHYCHEWLYEHRPAAPDLPWFYVALSLGGVLGSVGVLISTLYIFKRPLEFVIILVVLLLWLLYNLYKSSLDTSSVSSFQRQLVIMVSVVVIVLTIGSKFGDDRRVLALERNFFGAKSVTEKVINKGDQSSVLVSLAHEVTVHGYEYRVGPYVGLPTSYYSATSGMGRLLSDLQTDQQRSLRVGVIGLGAGSLAAYCRPNDYFSFYEIDPEVKAIAENYFTYLDKCPGQEVIIGDARRSLVQEVDIAKEPYDVIVVDAYADDAVPAHLMTKEAIELYLSRLSDDGVIAIHISSRYLDLLPVVAGLASGSGLVGKYYHDKNPADYATGSVWTFLSRQEQAFSSEKMRVFNDLEEIQPVFWTDSHNSIWSVVRLW